MTTNPRPTTVTIWEPTAGYDQSDKTWIDDEVTRALEHDSLQDILDDLVKECLTCIASSRYFNRALAHTIVLTIKAERANIDTQLLTKILCESEWATLRRTNHLIIDSHYELTPQELARINQIWNEAAATPDTP